MKHKKISDEEFYPFIKKELDEIKDLQMLILKGHIIVEYSLNKFIDDIADNSFDIFKENFQFSQKVKICKALGLFAPRHRPLEEIILTLNKVRNSIAHYLEFDQDEFKKLISLHKNMAKDVRPINESWSDFEVTREIIVAITGLTVGRKKGLQKIKKFSQDFLSSELKKNEAEFKKKFDDLE